MWLVERLVKGQNFVVSLYASVLRDANSLAISIPWGFGELGNGNLSFLGDQGNKNLFPGFRVGVRGNFGEYLVSDLKLIWNFFFLKRIFCFVKKTKKSWCYQGCAKTGSCYQLDCLEAKSSKLTDFDKRWSQNSEVALEGLFQPKREEILRENFSLLNLIYSA